MANISESQHSTPPAASKNHWLVVGVGLFAIVFGGLTIYSGGAVLFGDGEAKLAAGNFVPWVLWFNFLAGFIYLIAGYSIVFKRSWAAKIAWTLALATVLVSIIFAVYIALGNPYEMRTVGAMVLRSVVWILIAFLSSRWIARTK